MWKGTCKKNHDLDGILKQINVGYIFTSKMALKKDIFWFVTETATIGNQDPTWAKVGEKCRTHHHSGIRILPYHSLESSRVAFSMKCQILMPTNSSFGLRWFNFRLGIRNAIIYGTCWLSNGNPDKSFGSLVARIKRSNHSSAPPQCSILSNFS